MTTPINIIIDNKSVVDDVVTCEIDQAEGQYCSSVSLSLKSKSFWALCDPTTNFGTLRIKVVIGGVAYQFLVEERDTNPSIAGVAFTVWGRSKQALLAKPYSKTINDTDDTSHPWQSGATTASAIVAYVVSNYCPYSVTVNWNAGNFAVYADSFSVSNQSPIDVISALATVIGAELVAAADGSLSIEAYSVAEGSSVESYNDLDDIVQLSESIDYPSGYNAVTVYGYGSGPSGQTVATITAEKVDAEAIYPGRDHVVRVHYCHSQGHTPEFSFPEGNCQLSGSGVEGITENVTLIFGKGNTSKTNTDGETAVTGDESVPITTVSVSYDVNYQDYVVRGSAVETYNVMFYFADKSAYTVYSFSVVAAPGSEECPCPAVSITQDPGEGTVTVGQHVNMRVYGARLEVLQYSNGVVSGAASYIGKGSHSVRDELVVFTDGKGTRAYPDAAGSYEERSGNSSVRMAVKPVSYVAAYYKYRFVAPHGGATVLLWGELAMCGAECPLATGSVSIAAEGEADITLNVSNWASSANIGEVDVEVDGEWVGKTDSVGNVSVSGLAKGAHTVKLTKDGYLQSDLDDIENSTFEVE